ncbi:MAG: CapA family protein [Pseudomonadota bacterium]
MKIAVALASLLLLGACSSPGPAAPGPDVHLAFVGDVMLDTLPGEAVARGQDPFADFESLLQTDLNVANLECSVARGGTPEQKRFTFHASPGVVAVLTRHFGAVSLANNHSGDFGKPALEETMANLREGRLPFFGAGKDLASAHAPLILTRSGLRIALLGYDEFLPRSFEATPSTPGVAWSEDEEVVTDIRAALRAGADVVIPFLHWGWEGEAKPSDRQRRLARAMIDAGASAVIGSHPHVTQGAEMYRGRPIIYSLGNFVFDGFHEAATRTGWLARLTVNRRGVVRWDTVVARLDDQGLPHPDLDAKSPCLVAPGPIREDCVAGRAPGGSAP